MSTIVYSFHWVRRSIDEKNRHNSESAESIPTTSTASSITNSSSWFSKQFQPQINNQQQEYPYSNNFDFKFLHSILMAGPFLHIVLVCLITISTTTGYSVLDRILDTMDNQRILFNKTQIDSTSTFADCIPVQAVKQFNCPFFEKDSLHHELFESACEQHQLCYGCGFVHSITERKCDRLSRIYMYELCFENASSKFDCLKTRYSALILLERDVYRSTDFSFECSDKCVLNYLLNPE